MTPFESDMRLFERWQRGFPLVPRPYAAIGRELGLSEADVIERLRRLKMAGVLARVGATVRPHAAGASTLAAMSVPPDRLEEVAAIVNAESNVTHNYEREHTLNLWFVVTAAERASVARVLDRIRRETRREVLALPLLRSYFVDLGFPLDAQASPAAACRRTTRPRRAVPHASDAERRLLCGMEDGLPLAPFPYRRIAARLRLDQHAVLGQLASLLEAGVINRLGLIVRHHELGFAANAMAVWDVADAEVDRIGEHIATLPFVTLCYRRQRCLPQWPHNLFCMVHGRDRDTTLRRIAEIAGSGGIADRPRAVLFSTRRFKQRGATLARA